MTRALRLMLYILVIAPAILCGYMIYKQVSVAEAKGRIKELNSDIDELRTTHNDLSGKVKAKTDLLSWEEHLRSKETNLSERETAVINLETNASVRIKLADERMMEADKRVQNAENRIDELDEKIASNRVVLANIIGDIASTNGMKTSLLRDIDNLVTLIQKKQREYNNLDKEVRDLQDTRLEMVKNIRNKEKELHSLLTVVNIRIGETNELAKIVSALDKEIKHLFTISNQLDIVIANLDGKKSDLEARLKISQDAVKKALIAETNALTSCATFEQNLATLNVKLEQNQAKLEGVTNKLVRLAPIAESVDKLEELKQQLQRNVTVLQTKTNEMTIAVGDLKRQKDNLLGDEQKLKEATERMRINLLVIVTNALVSCASAEQSLATLNAELGQKQAQLGDVKAQLERLAPEAESLDNLDRQKSLLQNIVTELQAKTNEIEIAVGDLKRQRDNLLGDEQKLKEATERMRINFLTMTTNFVSSVSTNLNSVLKEQ